MSQNFRKVILEEVSNDAFAKEIYKMIRNKAKKLEKINKMEEKKPK